MNKFEELQRILRLINNELHVTEEEMTSKSRLRERVWARYIFCQLAKDYLYWTERQTYSYLHIDRTNMFHCQGKHIDLLNYDREYQYVFRNIMTALTDEIGEMPKARPLTQAEVNKIRLFNKGMLIGIDPVENYSLQTA